MAVLGAVAVQNLGKVARLLEHFELRIRNVLVVQPRDLAVALGSGGVIRACRKLVRSTHNQLIYDRRLWECSASCESPRRHEKRTRGETTETPIYGTITHMRQNMDGLHTCMGP
jgi:hypothetical protein